MRVLDAFSCRGGSRKGWEDRGHEVVSVDIVDYSASFAPGTFFQADAVEFTREHGHKFDLIAGSPPCEFWTRGMAWQRAAGTNPYPRLIAAFRDACLEVDRPFIIENVADARDELYDPILLCGRMFNLTALDTHPDAQGMKLILDRHRLFEFGKMPRPAQPPHPVHTRTSGIGLTAGGGRYLTGHPHVAGVYGGARRDPWEAKYVRRGGYVPKDIKVLQDLLGTPHIDTERELFEAIPPAYTSWLSDRVMEIL